MSHQSVHNEQEKNVRIDAMAIILKMANYMICVYLHSIGVHILMYINVIEW